MCERPEGSREALDRQGRGRITRSYRRLVAAAVVVALVVVGMGVARGVHRSVVKRRMGAIDVPVYQGAQGTVRVVDPVNTVLVVQYRAPVAYPSTDVAAFYEKELARRGWTPTVGLSLGGDREWSWLGADLLDSEDSKGRGAVFEATWRDARRDLTLSLDLVATVGDDWQDVVVNVRHPAQPEVSLGLRPLKGSSDAPDQRRAAPTEPPVGVVSP